MYSQGGEQGSLEIEHRWRGAPSPVLRGLTSSPLCTPRGPPAPLISPWGLPALQGREWDSWRAGLGAGGSQAPSHRSPSKAWPEGEAGATLSVLQGWNLLSHPSSPSLEPGECHFPIPASMTAGKARYPQQACLLPNKPRGPFDPQEPLGELVGKDGAEGEARTSDRELRLGLEHRVVAQRGQGL